MGEPSRPRVKVLWIRPEYLQEILAGRKTIEVRVGYSNIRKLRTGDLLRLNDTYFYRIRRIAQYPDFEALLAHEPTEAIAPGISEEELRRALRSIYPPEKEALGVIALEIEPASEQDVQEH
ncbi:MAG TPA: ASCH domain-containing protein [Caldilineae bacterium]|nr:ASCH domain-containing protein [Caldilineae bacterium]